MQDPFGDTMRDHPLYRYAPRILLLCVVALLLTACDRISPPDQPAAQQPANQAKVQPKRVTIALVMKTLTNPFFVEMERGARRAEQEFGINLLVKTGAQETSIQQQIGIVESLIHDKVDGIVIAPGDSVELIPILKKAQAAGIPVVNIDNQLDPAYSRKSNLLDVPFISVDNRHSAYQSAKYIADQVTTPSKALLMEGIRSAKNAEMRMLGASQAFRENPRIELVAKDSANWKIDEGYHLMQQWLTRYPDAKLVFAANDMMALGAIKAVRESGREDILIASYDALDEARQAIREGTLQATVNQQPEQQGYLGVHYAIRLINGETLPPETLVETVLLTRDNIDD